MIYSAALLLYKKSIRNSSTCRNSGWNIFIQNRCWCTDYSVE